MKINNLVFAKHLSGMSKEKRFELYKSFTQNNSFTRVARKLFLHSRVELRRLSLDDLKTYNCKNADILMNPKRRKLEESSSNSKFKNDDHVKLTLINLFGDVSVNLSDKSKEKSSNMKKLLSRRHSVFLDERPSKEINRKFSFTSESSEEDMKHKTKTKNVDCLFEDNNNLPIDKMKCKVDNKKMISRRKSICKETNNIAEKTKILEQTKLKEENITKRKQKCQDLSLEPDKTKKEERNNRLSRNVDIAKKQKSSKQEQPAKISQRRKTISVLTTPKKNTNIFFHDPPLKKPRRKSTDVEIFIDDKKLLTKTEKERPAKRERSKTIDETHRTPFVKSKSKDDTSKHTIDKDDSNHSRFSKHPRTSTSLERREGKINPVEIFKSKHSKMLDSSSDDESYNISKLKEKKCKLDDKHHKSKTSSEHKEKSSNSSKDLHSNKPKQTEKDSKSNKVERTSKKETIKNEKKKTNHCSLNQKKSKKEENYNSSDKNSYTHLPKNVSSLRNEDSRSSSGSSICPKRKVSSHLSTDEEKSNKNFDSNQTIFLEEMLSSIENISVIKTVSSVEKNRNNERSSQEKKLFFTGLIRNCDTKEEKGNELKKLSSQNLEIKEEKKTEHRNFARQESDSDKERQEIRKEKKIDNQKISLKESSFSEERSSCKLTNPDSEYNEERNSEYSRSLHRQQSVFGEERSSKPAKISSRRVTRSYSERNVEPAKISARRMTCVSSVEDVEIPESIRRRYSVETRTPVCDSILKNISLPKTTATTKEKQIPESRKFVIPKRSSLDKVQTEPTVEEQMEKLHNTTKHHKKSKHEKKSSKQEAPAKIERRKSVDDLPENPVVSYEELLKQTKNTPSKTIDFVDPLVNEENGSFSKPAYDEYATTYDSVIVIPEDQTCNKILVRRRSVLEVEHSQKIMTRRHSIHDDTSKIKIKQEENVSSTNTFEDLFSMDSFLKSPPSDFEDEINIERRGPSLEDILPELQNEDSCSKGDVIEISSDEENNTKTDNYVELTTAEAAEKTKNYYVSLLYICDQFYQKKLEMDQVKEEDKNKLNSKKLFYAKRYKNDMVKFYDKLTQIRVKKFDFNKFFTEVIEVLKIDFQKYKHITNVVIVSFVRLIVWVLIDNFTSPSDETLLFNHITSFETVEQISNFGLNKNDKISQYDLALLKIFKDFSFSIQNTCSKTEKSPNNVQQLNSVDVVTIQTNATYFPEKEPTEKNTEIGSSGKKPVGTCLDKQQVATSFVPSSNKQTNATYFPKKEPTEKNTEVGSSGKKPVRTCLDKQQIAASFVPSSNNQTNARYFPEKEPTEKNTEVGSSGKKPVGTCLDKQQVATSFVPSSNKQTNATYFPKKEPTEKNTEVGSSGKKPVGTYLNKLQVSTSFVPSSNKQNVEKPSKITTPNTLTKRNIQNYDSSIASISKNANNAQLVKNGPKNLLKPCISLVDENKLKKIPNSQLKSTNSCPKNDQQVVNLYKIDNRDTVCHMVQNTSHTLQNKPNIHMVQNQRLEQRVPENWSDTYHMVQNTTPSLQNKPNYHMVQNQRLEQGVPENWSDTYHMVRNTSSLQNKPDNHMVQNQRPERRVPENWSDIDHQMVHTSEQMTRLQYMAQSIESNWMFNNRREMPSQRHLPIQPQPSYIPAVPTERREMQQGYMPW